MNRWLILGVMMFIVFIMGMFIDWAAILCLFPSVVTWLPGTFFG